MTEDEDWRLRGQEGWLQGKTLHWRRWVAPKPTWDHDHCDFCFTHICDSGDGQTEGWVTEDNGNEYWVCAACCEDFLETFNWELVRLSQEPFLIAR